MMWESGDEGDDKVGEGDLVRWVHEIRHCIIGANGDEDVGDGRRRVLAYGRVERRNKRRGRAREEEMKGARHGRMVIALVKIYMI